MIVFRNKIINFFLTLLMVIAQLFLPVFVVKAVTSSSYEIQNPVIDEGLGSSSSSSFNLGQSLNQPAIGKSASSSFQLLGGFQYYYKVLPNVLSATAGNGEVSLSWAAPQTFLGVSVGSYELGVGTSSSVYTYQSVGSVTSYVKTGLSNGTTYYFKLKSLASGGTFLVFSNEVSATPTGSSVSGGTSNFTPSSINAIGFAPPFSKVHVLLNSSELQSKEADGNGKFVFYLNNLPVGPVKLSFYATDNQGRNSAWNTLNVTLLSGGTKNLENILIPPIVSAEPPIIKTGQVLNLSGITIPNSDIEFEIVDEKNKVKSSFDLKSIASGLFSKEVNLASLDSGTYKIFGRVSYGSIISPKSLPAEFWLNVKPNIPPDAGLGRCGDYNRDGKINIIDFSILIYWFGKANPPAHIDCNRDNQADLIDFSILMYYWTG